MFTREKQISCPYDKAHLIYASKMQSHLVKCERNHQDLKKVVCPFNSVHRMDEESYISHISVCRNRRVIDSHRFYVENQNIFKPHAYKKLVLPPEEEDWDSAPHFPTYNPNDYLDKNCLLRKPVGKSRSERKKFYLKEIVKFERYQQNGIIEETDSEEEEEDKRSLKESESGYATNTESTISEKQELKLAQLNKINEVPLSPLLGLGRGTSFQRNKIDRDNRPGKSNTKIQSRLPDIDVNASIRIKLCKNVTEMQKTNCLKPEIISDDVTERTDQNDTTLDVFHDRNSYRPKKLYLVTISTGMLIQDGKILQSVTTFCCV